MKRFILSTCVFSIVLSLIPTFAWAGPLDIPDDFRQHANQVEFLTNFARRCDLRLQVFGKSALTDETCKTFLARIKPVMTVSNATNIRWKEAGHAAAQSSNASIHRQWLTFHQTLNANMDIIDKVLDHIKFVRTS